jgi:WhiB family redox-sensing transcriptional regulator
VSGHAASSQAILPSLQPRRILLPVPPGDLELPVLPGALCRGQDPGWWFPGPGRGAEEAKAVCSACPERTECLDWAVQADERDGIWGGTTPGERTQIRRAARQGRGRS